MLRKERVRYNNCPLVEVVLQVNFSTILVIETILPVSFQEKIRTEYPNYQTNFEEEGLLSLKNVSGEVQPVIQQRTRNIVHNFISLDGTYKVSLSKNKLNISTLKYSRWEGLFDKFVYILDAFITTYNVTCFERIGLRYIDVFDLKTLNAESYQWKDILEPHILGCLNMSESKEYEVKTSFLQSEILLNGTSINFEAGLATINKEVNISKKQLFCL